MKPKETVSTHLDQDELARIDKLAQERGLSRDAMLTVLVSRGLTLFENDADRDAGADGAGSGGGARKV